MAMNGWLKPASNFHLFRWLKPTAMKQLTGLNNSTYRSLGSRRKKLSLPLVSTNFFFFYFESALLKPMPMSEAISLPGPLYSIDVWL